MLGNCRTFLFAGLSLWLAMSNSWAQSDHLEAARRHMVRGIAAIEAAKSPGDLVNAVAEFRKATEIAPEMAPAWFNLGAIEAKLGHYPEAINAYQRYLKLSPKATDAQTVQDEIIKLEYRQEQYEESIRPGWVLVGTEVAQGTNLNYYIDRSTIKKTAEGILVAAMLDYQQSIEWGPSRVTSYSPEWVFDCAGKRAKFMGAIYYTEHMGGGTVITDTRPVKSQPDNSGIGKTWFGISSEDNVKRVQQIFVEACRYR